MQSQAEAESICYDSVLRDAERHMEESDVPTSGKCRECRHCVWGLGHVDVSPENQRTVEDKLGICTYEDGDPCIVELASEHDEGECFWYGGE